MKDGGRRLRPTRPRVYYGWRVAAVAMGGMYVTMAIIAFSPPVFLKPMAQELEWSRTDYYLVNSVAHVIIGLLSPFVGHIVDRGNVRVMVLLGGLVTGATVMAYSQVHSLLTFWVLSGFLAPLGLALCGSAVLHAVIVKWFVRQRGRAVAALGAGANIGGITTAPLAAFLIGAVGWRSAWMVLGGLAIVWALVAGLVIRRAPEDLGLKPDNEPETAPASPLFPSEPEQVWPWREVVRTATFWLILLSVGVAMAAAGGVALHTYPFLTDKGMSPGVAATMLSSTSVVGLAFRPVWGYLLERWDPRRAALILFLSFTASTIGLVVTDSVPLLYLSMAIRGIGAGGLTAIMPILYGHYFGRHSVGQIIGLYTFLSLPLTAVGPVLSAVAFDTLGGYELIFVAFVAAQLAGAVIILQVRQPKARPIPAVVTHH